MGNELIIRIGKGFRLSGIWYQIAAMELNYIF
jgi:hypothetical protein